MFSLSAPAAAFRFGGLPSIQARGFNLVYSAIWRKKIIQKKSLQLKTRGGSLVFNYLNFKLISENNHFLTIRVSPYSYSQNFNLSYYKNLTKQMPYSILINLLFWSKFSLTIFRISTAALLFLFLNNSNTNVLFFKKRKKTSLAFTWNIRFVLTGDTILLNSYFL